jgi:protein-S-isoprenylcysteine O-methyltransferase Ste14
MKQRVKIDSALLQFVIILTGFLYLFPQLYTSNMFFDDIFDFLGLLTVLSGTFLRMSARGHKKIHSRKGHGLVLSGPYTLVRNPMYLGSFLMGSGFVLIVWPWWALPLFSCLFYLRFRRQILKEEKHLMEIFGETYENYCRKIPAMIPHADKLLKVRFTEVFPFFELWLTQEKYGLLGWPVLAFLLETFQENVVYGFSSFPHTFKIFFVAFLVFAAVAGLSYQRK